VGDVDRGVWPTLTPALAQMGAEYSCRGRCFTLLFREGVEFTAAGHPVLPAFDLGAG
jgi:hypothetical protein